MRFATVRLEHRNERFLDPAMEPCRQLLSVRVDDRLLAERDNRLERRKREKQPEMFQKSRVVPPADALAWRRTVCRSYVAQGRVRDAQVGRGGEFEEGRVERQDGLALCAGAFGKKDDAFSLIQLFNDLGTGPRDVAAVLAVGSGSAAEAELEWSLVAAPSPARSRLRFPKRLIQVPPAVAVVVG